MTMHNRAQAPKLLRKCLPETFRNWHSLKKITVVWQINKWRTDTYVFPTFYYVQTPQIAREFIVLMLISKSINSFSQMAWIYGVYTLGVYHLSGGMPF